MPAAALPTIAAAVTIGSGLANMAATAYGVYSAENAPDRAYTTKNANGQVSTSASDFASEFALNEIKIKDLKKKAQTDDVRKQIADLYSRQDWLNQFLKEFADKVAETDTETRLAQIRAEAAHPELSGQQTQPASPGPGISALTAGLLVGGGLLLITTLKK